MLCHEYKCIYIHIPKVAGLSIHYFFADLLGYKLKAHAPLPLKVGHIKAQDFLAHELVDQEVFASYFKFCFVRNPWARIVSEYKFRGHQREYDFKTFLFKNLPEPSDDDQYIHILPQYDFIFDHDGQQLVDFVGRYEQLQKDFHHVCHTLGVTDSSLPHLNKLPQFLNIPRSFKDAYTTARNSLSLKQKRTLKKNNYNHYTEYYDNESREFVASLYQKDIEAFAYEFDK